MRSKKNTSSVSEKMFNILAARNVRKSAKDYFIYFLTLMFSVCLFYSFNSISTQFASLGLEDTFNYLAFSSGVLTVCSILVCFIMGALVVYANRFLLKRRKKEMGVYATLGMERGDLNRMLMKETFIIGGFSLVAGIVLGIFAGQILSLATAKIIGLSLTKYSFMISSKAIVLSIIFFGILFFFVHLFNVKELKKMSLLDMLYADRKNETITEGKRGTLILLAILSLILILGGYGVFILMSGNGAFSALGLGGLLLIIGTVFFFSVALRIAAKTMKNNQRYYYCGLNMFTVSQFSTRLKTEGRSVSMIAVLLFLAMSLMMIGPGSGKFVMNGVEKATPYTGSIYYAPQRDQGKAATDPMEYLKQSGIDINSFTDQYMYFWTYVTPEVTDNILTGALMEEVNGMSQQDLETDATITFIGLEDYNRMLSLQNARYMTLDDGEFAVNYTFPQMKKPLEIFRESPKPVIIGDKTLTLAENGIWNYAQENSNVLIDQGTIIIPQYLVDSLAKQRWILNYNYVGEDKDSASDLMERWLTSAPHSFTMWTRQEALISVTSDNLLLTYLGIYLGITFLITSGAVLALQQLSQSIDNVKHYTLLKKLGVSRKDMKCSLMKQLCIYFGFPLAIALLHSAIVVWSVFRYFQGLETAVAVSVVGFSTILVLVVYAVYFITTYVGSRRILEI